MIQVENLTYSYGEDIILEDLSFEEGAEGITVIWGRNGAGKTTLMKLLAGHENPSKGTVKIKGSTPYNRKEVVQSICYMQEDHPFNELWRVADALRFGQYFHANWDKEMADELLKIFKLDGKKKISKLSKGMKSSLQFIIGICSHAEMTIFDEPSNGLDASMRKKMHQVLLESQLEHPRLILLSTHHIEEVQSISDSIMVIHKGRVFLHQSSDELRAYGIWLAGDKKRVLAATEGHHILEKSALGSQLKVMVDVPYHEKWKETASKHDLSIESVKLQDYLLSKTEEVE